MSAMKAAWKDVVSCMMLGGVAREQVKNFETDTSWSNGAGT